MSTNGGAMTSTVETDAEVRPFQVEVAPADLDDLRRRLAVKPMGARR